MAIRKIKALIAKNYIPSIILLVSILSSFTVNADTRSVQVKITSIPSGIPITVKTGSSSVTSLGVTPIEKELAVPAGEIVTVSLVADPTKYILHPEKSGLEFLTILADAEKTQYALHREYVEWKELMADEFKGFGIDFKREILKLLTIYSQVYTTPQHSVGDKLNEGEGALDQIRLEFPEFRGTLTEHMVKELFGTARIHYAFRDVPGLDIKPDLTVTNYIREVVMK
jgi:hypothetical protein